MNVSGLARSGLAVMLAFFACPSAQRQRGRVQRLTATAAVNFSDDAMNSRILWGQPLSSTVSYPSSGPASATKAGLAPLGRSSWFPGCGQQPPEARPSAVARLLLLTRQRCEEADCATGPSR